MSDGFEMYTGQSSIFLEAFGRATGEAAKICSSRYQGRIVPAACVTALAKLLASRITEGSEDYQQAALDIVKAVLNDDQELYQNAIVRLLMGKPSTTAEQRR